MYSLGVRRQFSARHYLIDGDWGEENIEHSHLYRMELVLHGKELDRHGFLADIVEVERHLDDVTAGFREKTFNSLPAFAGSNPSIERLAAVLHDIFRKRFESFRLEAITVTIWEDDIAWTSYHDTL
ncbi:MAG: 6-pyruvoyl tetrahydropterin synthase [Desulfobulbaceae bacterium BRH_c16a]|nr:MAG: 6-pyruvoyl tetrahydropterin synthase [Desulfobulbaceae bacterium BRH_c16a]